MFYIDNIYADNISHTFYTDTVHIRVHIHVSFHVHMNLHAHVRSPFFLICTFTNSHGHYKETHRTTIFQVSLVLSVSLVNSEYLVVSTRERERRL